MFYDILEEDKNKYIAAIRRFVIGSCISAAIGIIMIIFYQYVEDKTSLLIRLLWDCGIILSVCNITTLFLLKEPGRFRFALHAIVMLIAFIVFLCIWHTDSVGIDIAWFILTEVVIFIRYIRYESHINHLMANKLDMQAREVGKVYNSKVDYIKNSLKLINDKLKYQKEIQLAHADNREDEKQIKRNNKEFKIKKISYAEQPPLKPDEDQYFSKGDLMRYMRNVRVYNNKYDTNELEDATKIIQNELKEIKMTEEYEKSWGYTENLPEKIANIHEKDREQRIKYASKMFGFNNKNRRKSLKRSTKLKK